MFPAAWLSASSCSGSFSASAVFFVAMRGGPRGARESLHAESKAGRRAGSRSVIVLLFAFGLVVPALVLVFNRQDKASAGPWAGCI